LFTDLAFAAKPVIAFIYTGYTEVIFTQLAIAAIFALATIYFATTAFHTQIAAFALFIYSARLTAFVGADLMIFAIAVFETFYAFEFIEIANPVICAGF
jgi:hypothetical protein